MPVQRLKEFLDRNSVHYVVIIHSRAYTAAAIAAITHIPGNEIAKNVMVRLDGQLAMAVVPASRYLDLDALRSSVGAKDVSLVTEKEFEGTFPDCEVGAMPPFGVLYDMPVYIDDRLSKDLEIAFNAGSHRELVRLAYKDFERLQHPRVLQIATRSEAERGKRIA
ncbi:MAG TPA: YbaK/EbsC family protein [Clostridia bacterium]|nr:YbaK/EbsC family protein [Clostridia bacterium]